MDCNRQLDFTPIAWTLRKARRQVGLTLTEVAKLAGIHEGTLSRLERGEAANPSYEYMARLACVFQLSLDELAAQGGVAVGPQTVNPETYTDSRLRFALHKLQTDVDPQWRDHVITTLHLLVTSHLPEQAELPR